MALIIEELLSGSRTINETKDGKGDSAILKYRVSGTTSEIVAGSLAAQTTPSQFVMPGGNVINLASIQTESAGYDDLWDCTCTYRDQPGEEDNPNQPNLFATSFDTSGGTFHISNSKKTTSYGDNPEDWGGAINVDADRNVSGVDVVVPQLRIDKAVVYPQAFATDSFVNTVADLTGKVNDGTFFGRAAGEVLLLGAAGENTGQPIVTINYSFLISENLTNLTIGQGASAIPSVNKKGHEYLWVYYSSKAGNTTGIVNPHSVYVEEVYDSGDFSLLGIPGA